MFYTNTAPSMHYLKVDTFVGRIKCSSSTKHINLGYTLVSCTKKLKQVLAFSIHGCLLLLVSVSNVDKDKNHKMHPCIRQLASVVKSCQTDCSTSKKRSILHTLKRRNLHSSKPYP
ncbi:hypothetical protein Hanom_Chr03g00278531 [Helianthus anomalus]